MVDQAKSKKGRLVMAFHQAVRDANREVIHKMIPDFSIETALPVITHVAKARGRYLAAAFKLTRKVGTKPLDKDQVAKLRELRESYEEALRASQALEYALDKGYLDPPGEEI